MSSTNLTNNLSYKRTWTPSEDATILKLVKEHGASNWGMIADGLVARTGKQCRERYHNHLQPDVKKGDWTVAEDNLIVELQKKYGNQWARITKELPGRTDNAVKNRWHAAMRSQQKRAEGQVTKNKTVVPRLNLGEPKSSSGVVSEVACTIDEIVRKYSPRFVNDMHLSDSVDLNMLSHGHHMHSHIPVTGRSEWVPTPRHEDLSKPVSAPSHALSVFLNASLNSEVVTVNGVTGHDISELSKLLETVRNSPRPTMAAPVKVPALTRFPSAARDEYLNSLSEMDHSDFTCPSEACGDFVIRAEDSLSDFERFCWASPRISPRVSHVLPRARMHDALTMSKCCKRNRHGDESNQSKKAKVVSSSELDSVQMFDCDISCFDKLDSFGDYDHICF